MTINVSQCCLLAIALVIGDSVYHHQSQTIASTHKGASNAGNALQIFSFSSYTCMYTMNSSNKCRNCQFNDNSPSGAGKSTLLNILAGRTKSNKNLTVSADVRLDSYSVDPTDVGVRKQIAFVAQDDSLTQTSTPREAIRFSAKLRLPRTTTDDELDALVSLERLCLHYSISNFTS